MSDVAGLTRLLQMQRQLIQQLENSLHEREKILVNLPAATSTQITFQTLTWKAENGLVTAVEGMDMLLIPLFHQWSTKNASVIKGILAASTDKIQEWLPLWSACLTEINNEHLMEFFCPPTQTTMACDL